MDGRIVGAVAIHEYQDVGGVRCFRAAEAGKPVTAPDRQDFGAGTARDFLQ